MAIASDQPLSWARIDFLRNQVQLVPNNERAREARIADFLGIGDALRTARAARAELRFNDGSLARIGERATFRFTPNTRNFQLTNGTVLMFIPPNRGRSTIQTPNAVTGIQGSALFVRYIPETDTTIVGALTDNPEGPMVLFNSDGSERQALRANEIGVVENGQITQIYQFNSELFWQTSGLAQGFNYLQDSPTGSDALDAVRQEIRDAINKQGTFTNDNRVIENPPAFSRPDPPASVSASPAAITDSESVPADNPASVVDSTETTGSTPDDGFAEVDLAAAEELEFEGSAAEAYLSEANVRDANAQSLSDRLPDAAATEDDSSPESDEILQDETSAIEPAGATTEPDDHEATSRETDIGQDTSSEGVVTDPVESVDTIDPNDQEPVDSTTPRAPGRIRRNGSSTDDTPASEVPEPSSEAVTPVLAPEDPAPASVPRPPVLTTPTPVPVTRPPALTTPAPVPVTRPPASAPPAPAPVTPSPISTPARTTPVAPNPTSLIAPVLDPSTSLELTVDANRPGRGDFTPPHESMQSPERPPVASPVQRESVPTDAPPAAEPPSANVTIPSLAEQEISPINQGVPLQPELRLIEDAPIMKDTIDREDDHTMNGTEISSPGDDAIPESRSPESSVSEEGVVTPVGVGEGPAL